MLPTAFQQWKSVLKGKVRKVRKKIKRLVFFCVK